MVDPVNKQRETMTPHIITSFLFTLKSVYLNISEKDEIPAIYFTHAMSHIRNAIYVQVSLTLTDRMAAFDPLIDVSMLLV